MLYRGVKPPLVQAMVSKSIMFGLFNFYDELLTSHFGEHRGLNLVAAGMAGTSEAVLAPFEVRLQKEGGSFTFSLLTSRFIYILRWF